ncbi:hypothetical protein QNH36_20395 [Mesobacillus sp. AQ2]|jgi:hypothetical protein|uniref:hypothetical protein n=1 Tax=Bacillaceae TaxID=186817 RepID=UPI0011A945AC|nr:MULTISPECIES: hypothetical protein [Bacillaceae]MCM3125924.1 hypothetical protein [Mesobacillus sp. MER 33]MCM3235089.1 hypothetical protein [Mesobacillus sp. MER 48]WHX39978.1 hypothetical protein QNH36_20395 [Mesobacillus sp. AQ2]
MSFNWGSNILLFLACMVAGWALIQYGPMLLTLTGGIFVIIGVIVIVLFAFVIIFIGLRVLLRGGWRS